MEIKFVSYDGHYPNLCRGTLILELNGIITKFGYSEGCHYDRFWSPGGRVWFDSDWSAHVEYDEWILNKESLPEELKEYGNKLIDIFNENVEYGCCGGCI